MIPPDPHPNDTAPAPTPAHEATAALRDKMARNLARIEAAHHFAMRDHHAIHKAGRARADALGRDAAAHLRQVHAEVPDVHPADLDVLEPLLHERRRLETLFPPAGPVQE
jgi:hypothetical protein